MVAFYRCALLFFIFVAMPSLAVDQSSKSISKQTSALPTVGVAAFNMAWAGTAADFAQHRTVCGNPKVNWCETRARTLRGASAPTPEEQARATSCSDATVVAAGGQEASLMIAPCNAYRSSQAPAPGVAPPDPNTTRTAAAYQIKLDGLRETVEALIARDGVKVIAFQEVKSADVIKLVLGKYADQFDVCAAKHNAIQTLAFAWEKSLTSQPGMCSTENALAIKDPPNDPAAFRRVRPGLALTLTINKSPVTFMNVHLKAGCASVNNSNERFPGRLLTDANEACEVLNRQVPILENWIEAVAATSPRFVLLGDFNRRIDDEAAMTIDKNQVRSDGADPASPNKVDANGKVATRYLWQELSDGTPTMHQVPLSTKDGGCTGFQGLDHIVISDALKKINQGMLLSKKIGVVSKPDQVIETSDHCPRMVQLQF
jgi:endonuclease/exonuclease/phosphatase family metal-dependent hydrolase